MARDQNQPVALRVDATNVYWVNHGLDASGKETPNAGSILRAPKEGGTPVVIAANPHSAGYLEAKRLRMAHDLPVGGLRAAASGDAE